MEISRHILATGFHCWIRAPLLLLLCRVLYDIARSMLWERCLLYHHRGAFNRVHRGSPTLTLCCKQVCPEVNRVYTALGPLWCRCFSVRQCRVARPPSHCACSASVCWEEYYTVREHSFISSLPTLEVLKTVLCYGFHVVNSCTFSQLIFYPLKSLRRVTSI